MADLPSVVNKIQIEETDFRSPVSEQTMQKIGSVINYIIDNVIFPPGMIIPYAGDESSLSPAVLNAWIPCDGRAISRTTYANLYAAIGTRWGSGDGSTTFNVPDLRGLFLRGVDQTSIGAAGRDPDANLRGVIKPGGASGNNVGSYQSDSFKSHSHGAHGVGGAGTLIYSHYDAAINGFENYSGVTTSTGGSETRPKNAYVLYLIKT